jgi:hypothetical protein
MSEQKPSSRFIPFGRGAINPKHLLVVNCNDTTCEFAFNNDEVFKCDRFTDPRCHEKLQALHRSAFMTEQTPDTKGGN